MRDLSYIIPKILRKLLNPAAINNSKLTKTARCDIGAVVNSSSLGSYSYIGEYTQLLYTDVGNYCSISNYCSIGGAAHPIDWVSLSPAFNDTNGIIKSKIGRIHYEPFIKTTIGNDVWIGSHCLIKAGITISDGAVIGMGSVVTHDVGPFEIWAGNPAKFIRKRFDDSTIARLLDIRWWDKEVSELSKYAQYINIPEKFIEEIDG